MDQGLMIDPQMVLQPEFKPAIVTWNRLEGRPRREDFDRALRAEVRDPLWMLSRQWQLGEFIGEDSGSAVKAAVQVDTARLDHYSARTGPPTAYDDTLPLETMVEREPVPMDAAMRARIGVHWLRLLAAHAPGDHRAAYVAEFGPRSPENPEELARLESDQRAAQVHAALTGRMVDGGRLLDAIGDGQHLAFATAELPVAAQAGALIAAERLVEWLGRTYSQPASDEEDAWAPPYLEYQFACSAPAGPSTTTTLIAKQYHHGDLDWYSFDTGAAATGEAAPGGVVKGEPIAFSPTSIEFGGMPNVRWWELEDQQTDLGDLHASTTDLALLMLTEFGLSYANDWSLVPYDLEVGTLAEVRGVVVTDVFGVRTLIRAAGSGPGADWHRWGMYQLSQSDPDVDADTRLFLPPTLGPIEEGAPLERIILTRDEMANMVWAIEDVVPGFFGSGINGYEAATDLLRHLVGDGDEGVAEEARAELAYRLRTSVAENWIPFIPVRRPDTLREIQLQRAAMPRTADGSNTPVQPRSVVLRHALDLEIPAPYLVHEEEVARAGAIVTRSFQRTRWWDGRTYTWVGRRKQTGRGQGSSGLAFDSLVSAPR